MLTPNQIKEQLSYAHIHAIASRAGLQCGPGPHPDMDSVDVIVRARGLLAVDSVLASPQLELQFKATWDFLPDGDDSFSFQLPRKNYDDLRVKRVVPALLAIYLLPRDDATWMVPTPQSLTTRHGAFWCSLLGLPEIATETRAVQISRRNLITPEVLRELLTRVSREEEIRHDN